MSTTTAEITVKGMTCGHCVSAVDGELRKLPAVTDVTIALDSGRVVITSTEPIDIEAIQAAVDEAGYELT